MPRNAALRAKEKNQDSAPTADDVDKIRDIIFGGQMREYASRFEQLEKSVIDRIDRLSRDMEKRLDQLTQRLATEKEESKNAIATSRSQLRDLEHGVLEEGQQELTSLIGKARNELEKSLESETARLERYKLASKDLAQMFTEVARTLKQDSK